jgi:hypothetical protein
VQASPARLRARAHHIYARRASRFRVCAGLACPPRYAGERATDAAPALLADAQAYPRAYKHGAHALDGPARPSSPAASPSVPAAPCPSLRPVFALRADPFRSSHSHLLCLFGHHALHQHPRRALRARPRARHADRWVRAPAVLRVRACSHRTPCRPVGVVESVTRTASPSGPIGVVESSSRTAYPTGTVGVVETVTTAYPLATVSVSESIHRTAYPSDSVIVETIRTAYPSGPVGVVGYSSRTAYPSGPVGVVEYSSRTAYPSGTVGVVETVTTAHPSESISVGESITRTAYPTGVVETITTAYPSVSVGVSEWTTRTAYPSSSFVVVETITGTAYRPAFTPGPGEIGEGNVSVSAPATPPSSSGHDGSTGVGSTGVGSTGVGSTSVGSIGTGTGSSGACPSIAGPPPCGCTDPSAIATAIEQALEGPKMTALIQQVIAAIVGQAGTAADAGAAAKRGLALNLGNVMAA